MDYFEKLRKENSSEDFLFKKYRELDHRHCDDVQAKSWFLDQVLHPYELQHTLKEVVEIFQNSGVKLIGTSINNYKAVHSMDELFAMEKILYDVGMEYLNEQKYYPRFFYVLGERE